MSTRSAIPVLTWHGCYDDGWRGAITDESFQHPAKMARGLLERIVTHGFTRGWWKLGDVIGDPFGGIGSTGLIGAYHGLRVVSVELEPKFVRLSHGNFFLHLDRLQTLDAPLPIFLQGDSRRFAEIVGPVASLMTSPPYGWRTEPGRRGNAEREARLPAADRMGASAHGDGYGHTEGQIGCMGNGDFAAVLSSPPYAQAVNTRNGIDVSKCEKAGKTSQAHGRGYGAETGQIAECAVGNIGAVLSSPPYAGAESAVGHHNGIDYSKSSNGGKSATAARQAAGEAYGRESGQIASLPTGDVAGVVTSPPFSVDQPCASQSKFTYYNDMKSPKKRDHQMASAGNIQALAVGAVDSVITSPPYQDSRLTGERNFQSQKMPDAQRASENPGEGYGKTDGQISGLAGGTVKGVITSPPFRDCRSDTTKSQPTKGGGPCAERHHTTQAGAGYGQAEGQIDALPTGSLSGLVTSPPYADTAVEKHSAGVDMRKNWETYRQSGGGLSYDGYVLCSPPYADGLSHGGGREMKQPHSERHDKNLDAMLRGYGEEPGQIGGVRSIGTVDGAVTSPPWENNVEGAMRGDKWKDPSKALLAGRGNGASDEARLRQLERDNAKTYGTSDGQIGQEKAETYWQAMLQVYRQCFLAIRPGGVMAIVVKDYVKDKKRVPLCDQTLQLLEHIGFEPVERIRAMLVKETKRQGLFGEHHEKRERKSFFRRLAEAKGSPRIDWEEVLVVRVPERNP